MKNYLVLLLVMMVFTLTSRAQEVIGSAGTDVSNGNGQVSFTVGETVIETVGDEENKITQGFQQSNLTVLGIEEKLDEISVSVYPNPAIDYVVIDFGKNTDAGLDILLLDMNGKVVQTHSDIKDQQQHRINLSDVAAGNYFLNILNPDNLQQRNTYKIIKSH